MKKITIRFEKLNSKYIRLSLPSGQGDIAENQFENLKWTCQERKTEANENGFITTREKLAGAVKAFRSFSRFQTHDKNKNSPFQFVYISVFHSEVSPIVSRYGMGEHDNHSENVWAGYRSKAEKLFDCVK